MPRNDTPKLYVAPRAPYTAEVIGPERPHQRNCRLVMPQSSKMSRQQRLAPRLESTLDGTRHCYYQVRNTGCSLGAFYPAKSWRLCQNWLSHERITSDTCAHTGPGCQIPCPAKINARSGALDLLQHLEHTLGRVDKKTLESLAQTTALERIATHTFTFSHLNSPIRRPL